MPIDGGFRVAMGFCHEGLLLLAGGTFGETALYFAVISTWNVQEGNKSEVKRSIGVSLQTKQRQRRQL